MAVLQVTTLQRDKVIQTTAQEVLGVQKHIDQAEAVVSQDLAIVVLAALAVTLAQAEAHQTVEAAEVVLEVAEVVDKNSNT